MAPDRFSGLTVVVVNYASADLVEQNLARTMSGLPGAHAVVVDNLSTAADRAAMITAATRHGWRICLPDSNTGFGGGCNLGVAAALAAGCDRILLLNPDATIDSRSVALLDSIVRDDHHALVGPRIVDERGRPWSAGVDVLLDDGRMRSWAKRPIETGDDYLPWLSGACLALHADLWRRLGGFDEDYFLYWEDVDLSVRVQRSGGRIELVREAVAIHVEGRTHSSEERAKSPLYYFYNNRNRLLFARKLMPADVQARWRRRTVRAAAEIVLRGGRRQLARPHRNVLPAVRGLVDGLRVPVASQSGLRRARVYENIRSAHLERFRELPPAAVLFGGRNYDFATELSSGLDLQPFGSSVDLARALWRRDIAVVEVNEPLMLSALKPSLVAIATVRLRGFLRRDRPEVVSYAIGNDDPFVKSTVGRLRTPLRRLLFRSAVRLALGQIDRLAVGTPGAMDVYRRWIGRRTTVREILALPRACPTCVAPSAPDIDVAFVGAFDERKGVRQLLTAWPHVLAAAPGSRLEILGKGQLEDHVRRASADLTGVGVTVDPSRQVIHDTLNRSRVLVLLSQPTPTWREQVGLPIVEALSHGCRIVTTDETGLAAWLDGHGHQVLPAHDQTAARVASAILAALGSGPDPDDVKASLPSEDGRLLADRWMFDRIN